VDYFWGKLTADGGEESACGWLKDKFGLSWQVTPTVLIDMLHDKDPEKAERVMKAMLQMQKIEIPKLRLLTAGNDSFREPWSQPIENRKPSTSTSPVLMPIIETPFKRFGKRFRPSRQTRRNVSVTQFPRCV